MMHISIRERLRPFDHNFGTKCPLPGSSWCVQIFPCLIQISDLSSKEKLIATITTDIKGPIQNFTVQLDLEKGRIVVWGNSIDGFFRYSLTVSQNGKQLLIFNEKKTHPISFQSDSPIVSDNQLPYQFKPLNRLSLGCHKAQDWTLIKRRQDLKEILPFWLRLGELVLPESETLNGGMAFLLKQCEEAICQKKREEIGKLFLYLFQAGFQGIMTPTLVDDTHQGLNLPPMMEEASPLVLLSYAAKLIAKLFVEFQEDTLSILPALPVEFHSGRLTSHQCENLGHLDLEWSKKTVRRMILIVDCDRKIHLKLPKEIKSFRFQEEGKKSSEFLKADSRLELEKGKVYLFDRFEK